ncbi:MAG: LicD family protein, partial [Eggerthellaceae bacterium]|nr:LicD family protein [Eggerthellaceae bacterium]
MLSDVQLFNLVLVKEIDAICQKYGIEYYLAGGSVIGVLRHKGFIPWDDDMDLYMTRDNWLKFREAFDKEQPEDRILESSDINPNYPNMIAKYTSTNTTAIYKNLLSGNYAAGVIVDILILDPVPSDPAIQQQHLKNLLLYSEFVNRYYVFSHRFDIDVDFDAALEREAQIGHEALVREYEKLVTQYSEEESDTYVLRWGGVPHTFAKDLFATPKWMPFEGIMLPVPQKAFMYLAQLYGEDWIQLPPLEEERVHDAVFSIDRPYSEFFKEFDPHFDEQAYLEAI